MSKKQKILSIITGLLAISEGFFCLFFFIVDIISSVKIGSSLNGIRLMLRFLQFGVLIFFAIVLFTKKRDLIFKIAICAFSGSLLASIVFNQTISAPFACFSFAGLIAHKQSDIFFQKTHTILSLGEIFMFFTLVECIVNVFVVEKHKKAQIYFLKGTSFGTSLLMSVIIIVLAMKIKNLTATTPDNRLFFFEFFGIFLSLISLFLPFIITFLTSYIINGQFWEKDGKIKFRYFLPGGLVILSLFLTFSCAVVSFFLNKAVINSGFSKFVWFLSTALMFVGTNLFHFLMFPYEKPTDIQSAAVPCENLQTTTSEKSASSENNALTELENGNQKEKIENSDTPTGTTDKEEIQKENLSSEKPDNVEEPSHEEVQKNSFDYEGLINLKKQLDNGEITEEEFNQKKKELI